MISYLSFIKYEISSTNLYSSYLKFLQVCMRPWNWKKLHIKKKEKEVRFKRSELPYYKKGQNYSSTVREYICENFFMLNWFLLYFYRVTTYGLRWSQIKIILTWNIRLSAINIFILLKIFTTHFNKYILRITLYTLIL